MSKTNTNAVTLDVAVPKLLEGLRVAFSSRNNVLLELLQNARRAGATSVVITADQHTFTIEDDGCGVSDFQALIRAGGSGWEGETQQREHPYGMGFLAALFAAERIHVESGTVVLDAPTQEILGQRPVGLGRVGKERAVHGTRITLSGHDLNITTETMQRLCRGMPVQVTFNGTDIERPHALDAQFLPTAVGMLRLAPEDRAHHRPVLYLQGAPIHSGRERYAGRSVLHLDPTLFKGRFPDREQLVDLDAAQRKIDAAVRAAVQDILRKERAAMAPEAFAEHWADHCIEWGVPEILNDCDALPSSWFIDPEAALANLSDDWLSALPKEPACIMRSELERGVVTDDALRDRDGGFAGLALARHHKLHCMNGDRVNALDDGHWLHARLIDEADIEVGCEGKIGTSYCWLAGTEVGVVACKAVTLQHPRLGLARVDNHAIYAGRDEAKLYAPCPDDDAIFQVSDFRDDDRSFDDMVQEAQAVYVQTYAEAAGMGAREVMRLRLEPIMGYAAPQCARGKRFTLAVAEDGSITVEDLP